VRESVQGHTRAPNANDVHEWIIRCALGSEWRSAKLEGLEPSSIAELSLWRCALLSIHQLICLLWRRNLAGEVFVRGLGPADAGT